MARFDVYSAPDGGYWLDCQSDLFGTLNSRFVAPLVEESERPVGDPRLTPVFEIGGVAYTMQAHLSGAVAARLLREPVTNLVEHEYAIGAALDLLLGRY
ncbi:CcdB family protein [Sphingomonas sp.]|uniref:CcdB family protein n=1 Tax=Sphingomonas sp. TaxID=28214 RepID=UPI0035C7E52F